MSRTETVHNPTRATGRNCDKCGQVFTTALDARTTCPACKQVRGAELAKLLGYNWRNRWGVQEP